MPAEAIHLLQETVITVHPAAAVTTPDTMEVILLQAEQMVVAVTLPQAVEGIIHPEAAEAALLQEEAHLPVADREVVEDDNKLYA
jgi:uncharacterized membrane protein (UPF0182 family)